MDTVRTRVSPMNRERSLCCFNGPYWTRYSLSSIVRGPAGDCEHTSLVYESRGKLQIKLLCGADDNPRDRMNTARQGEHDPCLTSLFFSGQTERAGWCYDYLSPAESPHPEVECKSSNGSPQTRGFRSKWGAFKRACFCRSVGVDGTERQNVIHDPMGFPW